MYGLKVIYVYCICTVCSQTPHTMMSRWLLEFGHGGVFTPQKLANTTNQLIVKSPLMLQDLLKLWIQK